MLTCGDGDERFGHRRMGIAFGAELDEILARLAAAQVDAVAPLPADRRLPHDGAAAEAISHDG